MCAYVRACVCAHLCTHLCLVAAAVVSLNKNFTHNLSGDLVLAGEVNVFGCQLSMSDKIPVGALHTFSCETCHSLPCLEDLP